MGRVSRSRILRTVLSLVFLPIVGYLHLPGPLPVSDKVLLALEVPKEISLATATMWKKKLSYLRNVGKSKDKTPLLFGAYM